ncbi:RagB/SusD family nutrient uptake outer membrane protein [Pontibacter sp. 13R65]|uniref:RagB/SusD family nutrient uptake outer membrane protein n=1 Tax=Pontibacter sp. 13R65 TaxID=3127458 RepID=UPI00301D90D6
MKKIKLLALFLVATFSTYSCKDALEETPYDFVGPNQLGNTEAAANLWVNGVLNSFNSGDFFAWGVFNRPMEADADDITGKDFAFRELGAGNFQSTSDLNTVWNGPYALIQKCSFAIMKIEEMTIEEGVKNNALGQLYFLRGWAYFTLVKAFGPVPIFKQSVTEGEDPNQPRASVPEVYDFIIQNLKEAETRLYTRSNGKYQKGRISQEAAKTLLSKVYLTMASGALANAQVTVLGGKQTQTVGTRVVRTTAAPTTYTKAVVAGHESFNAAEYFRLARDKAKEVMAMEGPNMGLFEKQMDIWTIPNRAGKEHLWQMSAISGSEVFGNIISFQYVGYINPNGTINGAHYGMADHWYDLFEFQDERIREGVIHRWMMFQPGQMHYYPLRDSTYVKNNELGYVSTDVTSQDQWHIAMLKKFAMITDRTVSRGDMHVPFLRYAETLLIFAEAENEANNGPTAEAYEALNRIRRRSNASDAPAGMNQQEFRSYVLEERRRELSMEMNRRWDLVRWGIYLPVMNAIDIDANNIIKRRQERHLLFPIPLNEVNGNTSINVNNPGW